MGALEDYLKQIPDTFDVSNLLDPDVEKIESTIYQAPIVYKYFPATRRQFFSKPQIRISQREALNDPLEMSARWDEIKTDGLRSYLKGRLAEITPKIASNSDLLFKIAKEDFANKGLLLSPQQDAEIWKVLESDAAKSLIKGLLPTIQINMQLMADLMFAHVESEFQTLIAGVISKAGVLSLTEDPLNEQMWAHYATGGKGFVIGIDAQHAFLMSDEANGAKNLLRKVIYTDEKTENFWRNPYFLFLVKSAGWSYEREWRLFRNLDKCDEEIATDGPPICLANLPSDIIKSVYFGYGYDPVEIHDDIANLVKFGATPEFSRVEVNRSKGKLELIKISA